MQRSWSLSILLFLCSLQVGAQECVSFDSLEERKGLSLSELESKYGLKEKSGTEEMQEVFIPEGTGRAYRSFIQGLGQYLADEEGVDWDSTVRYFQRIYFEPDGSAAYYLYQFKVNGFSGEERERFEELVEEYLGENEFEVDMEGRFALCAPVHLRPPEDGGEE